MALSEINKLTDKFWTGGQINSQFQEDLQTYISAQQQRLQSIRPGYQAYQDTQKSIARASTMLAANLYFTHSDHLL